MEISLLETTFEVMSVVDTYESLIWTDRYFQFGDFEVVVPVTAKVASLLTENRYLQMNDSDHLMVIEHLQIKSEIEEGNKIMVRGRSIESFLERRQVWPPIILNTDIETAIETILNQNFISPSDFNRTMPEVIFQHSGNSLIESILVNDQFGPDVNAHDAITKICYLNGVGFKLTLNDANKFVFELYLGTDRSYDQVDNPYVVFSPEYENIIDGVYQESNIMEKNMAFVAGEKGIGNEPKIIITAKNDTISNGLARREMYVDASGITRNVPNETPLTEVEYAAKLKEKGQQALSENIFYQSFEGQIDTTGLYSYGVDYFMGDIVQVADDYDHEAKSQVTEVTHSDDAAGIRKYPTFSTIS